MLLNGDALNPTVNYLLNGSSLTDTGLDDRRKPRRSSPDDARNPDPGQRATRHDDRHQ